MATGAELTYTTNVSALTMANAIFGNGTTVVGASLNVPNTSTAKGLYANGQLSPGVTPAESGIILSTGDIRSFTQSSGDPNRLAFTSGDSNGTDNDAQFNAIAGAQTFDGVWLNVDFIPTGSTMTMRFVLSSEEYPEYINSDFNDVMGVWVNGAYVPVVVGSGESSVNNINAASQENLVRNNTNDAFNTEMDGFTITLSLTMQVNPGVVNSIRIGVADTTDNRYDTNILIPADSVQTVLVPQADAVTIHPSDTVTLNVLANDQAQATLTITHLNGVAVVAGQTVTLPSGQTVTLNADGTLTIVGDGQAESKAFTYSLADTLGNTATGIVTVNQVPCFVAGTRILTARGEVAVERLVPGDLVMTLDDGLQPLRWTGQRTVLAAGPMSPVRLNAGAFGRHRTLWLSPQHRVLIRDPRAELLFGEAEVLVAAQDLVNGTSVMPVPGGEVTYVHLLFDRHQVICSEGLATESFQPGPVILSAMDDAERAEIASLFPELARVAAQSGRPALGCIPAARRVLRRHEAQVLFRRTRKAGPTAARCAA